MNKKNIIIAASLAATIIILVQFVENISITIDTKEIRNDIVKNNTRWLNALKGNDIDTLIELYTEDASLLPPNDTIKRGKSAIRLYFETLPRSQLRVVDASMTSREIFTSDHTIYEIGEYTFIIKPFDSDASRTDKGKYLTIWKYQSDGSLRMYAGCWNSNLPADLITDDPLYLSPDNHN